MQDSRLLSCPARSPAQPDRPLTFVAGRDHSVCALETWVQGHAQPLRALLPEAGALLLRGFALHDPADFARIATHIAGPLGDHYEGPSPRKSLAPGVYTASEVPSPLVVPEHAEMSYLPQMPRFLFFWCRTPARRGGGTTLVDARRLLQRLDAGRIAPLLAGPLRIRRRHARPRGLHDPFELKRWPLGFGTEDRDALRERVRSLGFAASFERDGAVTLEHEQTAVRPHPETGERAWLNHLLVFHASSPAASLRSAVLRDRSVGAAPLYPLAVAYRKLAALRGVDVATDVRLHDGSAIPEATVDHVRAVVEQQTTVLTWQRGDLLVVDNHAVLHGRRPFRGDRSVIAAWSADRA